MLNRLASSFLKFSRRVDHVLLGLCFSCSLISLALIWGIYNAGYIKDRVIWVQIAATLIGIGCALLITAFDYHFVAKMWKIFMPASMFLVCLTYFIGQKRADYIDDKAWLKIPFIDLSFQPSEILKLAFIITFALHLEKVHDSINNPKNLIGLCIHGAIPIFMIVLQGDHGTAMVFMVIFAVMLFSAGLSWAYIGSALGIALLASPIVWFFLFDEDKRMRFLIILNPELDPTGKFWQQGNGLVSIGSGQVFGKGLFSHEVSYIPEMHNDFIFAYAGEAMGFLGSIGILLILGFICVRIMKNAFAAGDLLGRYICVGVFAIIFFQTFWEVGMCLALLPVAGLPLPFFSAGGTSVVMTYASIGLVLNVHKYSNAYLFSEN